MTTVLKKIFFKLITYYFRHSEKTISVTFLKYRLVSSGNHIQINKTYIQNI